MNRNVRLFIAAMMPMFSLSCSYFRLTDRSPDRGGYLFVHAYHYCEKCGSLQGGIYEKGPFKSYPGEKKSKCRHNWQEITREEFKELATEKYAVDWDQDPMPFWNPDKRDVSPTSAR